MIEAVEGQLTSGTVDNAITTGNIVFPGSVTNGNIVILGVVCYSTSNDAFVAGDCTKVSGTSIVGTISLRHSRNDNLSGGDFHKVGVWEIPVIGSGTLTLTISGAPAGSYWVFAAVEYHTTLSIIVFDTGKINGATAATNPPDSGNVTTTGPGILFGVLATDVNLDDIPHTPDSLFSSLYEEQDGLTHRTGASIIHRITTGIVTDSASWVSPSENPWSAIVVSFIEIDTSTLQAHVGEPITGSSVLN